MVASAAVRLEVITFLLMFYQFADIDSIYLVIS